MSSICKNLCNLLLIFSIKFIVLTLSTDNYKNYIKIGFLHLCNQDDAISVPTLVLNSAQTTNRSALILHPNYMPYNFYKKGWNCTFFVQTQNENEQIIASIQSMTFHSLPKDDCIDYVEFESITTKKTQQFCGKMRRDMPWARWDSLLNINYETFNDYRNYNSSADLGFYDSAGKIKVTIFLDYGHRQEKLHRNLVIVFTAFKKYDPKERYPGKLFRVSSDTGLCLNEDYNCDGIKNCLTEFCNDENNCKT